MDPVTAVGLAGTIIQFVTFTRELLATASDIHDSAEGGLADVQDLQSICEQFHKFSTNLALKSGPRLDADSTLEDPMYREAARSIGEMSRSSKEDCDRISDIAARLQVRDKTNRRWKSFRAALEHHWKRKEITELDNRMQRRQAALTLQICTISQSYLETNKREVASLKRICEVYQIQQAGTIEKLEKTLQMIPTRFIAPEGSLNPMKAQATPVSAQDMQDLEEQFKSLSITPHLLRQQAIIVSLGFEGRRMRYNRIPDAHSKTFSWAFQERTGNQSWPSRLAEWFSKCTGIFWVAGKPGSGKSTFMKYLADHDETRKKLTTWAGSQKVFIASHYFWIAGTEMQRSQAGLLQELLLDILRQVPELIEHVSKQRYVGQTNQALKKQPWDIEELREALRVVAHLDINVRFCLFVDGLDEYDGDRLELCDILHTLTSSGRIKICASSRPWNDFKDNLGADSCRTISMHELTKGDIREYTTSRLQEHPRWSFLSDQPENGRHLVEEITERSNGVFLWVSIVTKLLREGLSNDDSYSNLKRRVQSFPSDLTDFFRHILDSVEPFYHPMMAGALQIAANAKGPLRYLMYNFLEQEQDDENYALDMEIRKSTLSEERLKTMHESVVRRLEGQCRGLLEVRGSHVDFLHRTVSDFLQTRAMADYLTDKSGTMFDANLALLRGSLASMKTTYMTVMERYGGEYSLGEGVKEVADQMRMAMYHVLELEEHSPHRTETAYELLDAMEETISILNTTSRPMIHPGPGETCGDAAKQHFRAHIIKNHVSGFLSWKLVREPEYLDDFDQPPLSILAHPDARRETVCSHYSEKAVHKVLNLLLENGEDPNELYCDSRGSDNTIEWTPWTTLLSQVITPKGINYNYMPRLDVPVFLSFLRHGADRNASVYRSTTNMIRTYSTAWVDFLNLIFTMKAKWTDDRAYLDVLDAFMEGNIDLDKLTACSNSSNKEQRVLDSVFFSNLKRCANGQLHSSQDAPEKGSRDSEPADRFPEASHRSIVCPKSYLLQEVVLRLLKAGHGQDWPMVSIWTLVESVFGARQRGKMQVRLAIMLGERTTFGSQRKLKRKREGTKEK